MENKLRDKFANEYAVNNYSGDEYNVEDFKKGWDCCEKEMISAVEQLKAENLDLKKTLNSVKNCQVGDFVVYHPTKDPDADNVFGTITALKSKIAKAKEKGFCDEE